MVKMIAHHKAKLTHADVELIREAYGDPILYGNGKRVKSRYKGVSLRSLADKFEVHNQTIYKIITYQIWRNA